MKPTSKKPFGMPKKQMDDIDAMISNEMNSRNKFKPNVQSKEPEIEQPIKPMMKVRKTTEIQRDSLGQKEQPNGGNENDVEQLDASGPPLLRPHKTTEAKKSVTKSPISDVDDLIKSEMNNAKGGLKKPSVYDSLKPSFAKKGKTDAPVEPQGEDAPKFVEETPKMMMKQPLGRPILKKREDGENQKKLTDESEPIPTEKSNPSISKPFDRKTPFNTGRKQGVFRTDIQQPPVEEPKILKETENEQGQGSGKTFNIKKKIEIKQRQAGNYNPIKTPIIKDDSSDYSDTFEKYQDESEVVTKPNIPVPQKGDIDWKERERLLKEEQERQEQERLIEEERRKQENIKKEEQRAREQERQKQLQETQLLDFSSREDRRGFQSNVLVSRAQGDSNIFANPSLNQQPPAPQRKQIPSVPTQDSVNSKGVSRPLNIKQKKLLQEQASNEQPSIITNQPKETKEEPNKILKKEQIEQITLLSRENEQEILNGGNYQTEIKAQAQYNPSNAYVYKESDMQINIAESASRENKVSEGRVQMQQQRIQDLKAMIQLELDSYESLLEIQPTTEYEVYIAKIKAGSLKNSGDQSDDNKNTQETQADLFQQNEFGNQCPEDQSRTFLTTNTSTDVQTDRFQRGSENTDEVLKITSNLEQDLEKNLDDATKLIEFMNKAFPVFEEILNEDGTKQQQQDLNDIYEYEQSFQTSFLQQAPFKIFSILCTLTQSAKSSFICYDIGLESPQQFRISAIIEYHNSKRVFIPKKICLTPYTVTNIAVIGSILLAGTQQGSIQLWDLRETEFTHLKQTNKFIETIKLAHASKDSENEQSQEIALRFPSFSSDFLQENKDEFEDKKAATQHYSSIVKLLVNNNNNSTLEFFSLEEFGKVISWNIIELSSQDSDRNYIDFGTRSKIKLMAIGVTDLTSQNFLATDILCHDLSYDDEDNAFYACSSIGVIKAGKSNQNKMKTPRVFGESQSSSYPCSICTSSQSEIIVVGYSDGSLKLFSKNFKDPLIAVSNFTNKRITNIFVNEQLNPITQKNQLDFNRLIVSDSTGNIFTFDLSLNNSKPVSTFNKGINNPSRKIVQARVHKLEGLNAVDIFLTSQNYENTSLKYNYGKTMETDLTKILEGQKKLELSAPSFYHDFQFDQPGFDC